MKYVYLILGIMLFNCCTSPQEKSVETIISKWKDDKRGAISITFDDGIINQLTVARPILDKYGLKGTFYIITGKVYGAQQATFIGRPGTEIIQETATIPTNQNNLFERASYLAYAGISEAEDNHARIGSLYEQGKKAEAFTLVDQTFEKIRNGTIENRDEVIFHNNAEDTTTWEEYRRYALDGHEIASHTVTHPRLAVLDEANMLFELEQSRADIEKFLGPEYTFSAECPYGTENERVMEYAMNIYPALRNRMPETYLEELNRSSNESPSASEREYVQWQRGPLTDTDMETMKGWVDTVLDDDNIWLVLVFHGVNGLGWEPKTDQELDEYFSYMKDHESDLWIAPFADVTKYIRERKDLGVTSVLQENTIRVSLSSSLDPDSYHVPLTLQTPVPADWEKISIKDNTGNNIPSIFKEVDGVKIVQYNTSIGASEITLTKEQ